jgi:DNA-binding NarL/FixJ family response regulator
MNPRDTHLKLMSTLPVRTVQAKSPERRKQGSHLSRNQRHQISERILELRARGFKRREIAEIVGVSRRTVTIHSKRNGRK